jgi:hypothetical protein
MQDDVMKLILANPDELKSVGELRNGRVLPYTFILDWYIVSFT